ncbi:Rrf2 family transcriptional regulator [Synergistaceae bacterium OttesenSCG-928-I11]|nr:Rrf2 family transcriptional regulator [Synergistaceae bacterium OttesenSCG-928-I11]
MRISVKCSSAIHVLLMIAMLPSDYKITSEFLASSVGNNPVEIRKLLSSLKKAGIIDVARGPGGAVLKKKPADITLLEVYNAVDSASLDELVGVHEHPAPQCLFGRNIANLLTEPYAEIGEAVRLKMASITLEQLMIRLQEMEPGFHEFFAD